MQMNRWNVALAFVAGLGTCVLGVGVRRGFADGACCDPNGTCAEIREYEYCPPEGYQGDGSLCSEVTCPTTTTTTLPPCGNGGLDAGEQCDDANADDNDCCPSDCQLPDEASCKSTGRSSFLLTDSLLDSRDKLRWNWKKGAATTIETFGDPDQTTAFHLCIETRSPSPTALASSIAIPAGSPPWSGGRKDWRLTSESLPEFSGITGIRLKPGAARKAGIRVAGGGEALPIIPVGIEGPLRVLLRSSTGECWSSGLMPITKIKAAAIKARR